MPDKCSPRAKTEDKSSSDWAAPELCSCQEMQLASSGDVYPQSTPQPQVRPKHHLG